MHNTMNILNKIYFLMLAIITAMLMIGLNPAFADDDDDDDGQNMQAQQQAMYAIDDNTAKMDIIVQGEQVIVRVIAPSMLLLGTELKPESRAEKADYSTNIEMLMDINNIIQFTDSANCSLKQFKESSPDLLQNINDTAKNKLNNNMDFDSMMDSNSTNSRTQKIKTTLLYDIGCNRPSRIASIKTTIFESFADLNKIHLRWRNNGIAGQKLIYPQDHKTFLYNRYGDNNNTMGKKNKGKDDDDD